MLKRDQADIVKAYAEGRIETLRNHLERGGDLLSVDRTRGAIGELRALVEKLEPRGEQTAPVVSRNSYLD